MRTRLATLKGSDSVDSVDGYVVEPLRLAPRTSFTEVLDGDARPHPPPPFVNRSSALPLLSTKQTPRAVALTKPSGTTANAALAAAGSVSSVAARRASHSA